MCARLLFLVVLTGVLTLSPVALVGSGQPAAASEVSPDQDARNRLNFAGRQRMLTQQIARNACFVMAGIDRDRYAPKTESAIRQFDTTLLGLRHGDPNLGLLEEPQEAVLADLEVVEGLWRTLGPASRQIAAGDLHSVPMGQLIRLNVEALKAMHQTVLTIEKHYGAENIDPGLARTINVAGRQRMLSQRASKEACFYLLDIEGGGSAEMIAGTIAEFDTAMSDLLAGSEEKGILAPPNRQIKKQLERTNNAWSAFKKLLIKFENTSELPSGERITLANLSDQVLLEMDLAVRMYAGQ